MYRILGLSTASLVSIDSAKRQWANGIFKLTLMYQHTLRHR